MKNRLKIIFALLFLSFNSQIFAVDYYHEENTYLLRNTSYNYFIDSITILPPLGNTKTSSNSEFSQVQEINDSLLEKMSVLIPTATDFYINYHKKQDVFNLNAVNYLLKNAPRFHDISEEIFSKVPIGEDL